jgi:hypothetical protein
MVSVQHDEYGAGRVERMHATLFAAMMRELDLDDSTARTSTWPRPRRWHRST